MPSDNSNGFILCGIGLLVLTLTGVAMSRLVERQISGSERKNSQKNILSNGATRIHELKTERSDLTAKLERLSTRRARTGADIEALNQERLSVTNLTSRLQSEKTALLRSIEKTEQEFSEYRQNYRKGVWRDAVGEKIDHLFLNTGRQLERVIITAVTPQGLSVSHASGTSRVAFAHLPKEYRDRFQWDTLPEKKTPDSNAPGQENSPSENDQLPEPVSDHKQESTAEKTVRISDLQNEAIAFQEKIKLLEQQYQVAESNSRYSDNKSVPGSLRTWQEQMQILSNELARTKARLILTQEQITQLMSSKP